MISGLFSCATADEHIKKIRAIILRIVVTSHAFRFWNHYPHVERALLDFLSVWVPAGKTPMCGNSIGQDRRFMVRYMPQLEAWFHYRNLDVSTLKELARRWAPAVARSFVKRSAHTALADIHESIDELRHYRQHFIAAPAPSAG